MLNLSSAKQSSKCLVSIKKYKFATTTKSLVILFIYNKINLYIKNTVNVKHRNSLIGFMIS